MNIERISSSYTQRDIISNKRQLRRSLDILILLFVLTLILPHLNHTPLKVSLLRPQVISYLMPKKESGTFNFGLHLILV